MKYDSFYANPMDYFVNEFLPEVNPVLEKLRNQKLIGKNRDAMLIVHTCSKETNPYINYTFFSLWSNQKFGGLRELAKVNQVIVLEDKEIKSEPYFRISAESIVGNPAFSQCPRCEDHHQRKNGWKKEDRFLCDKCIKVFGEDFLKENGINYGLSN